MACPSASKPYILTRSQVVPFLMAGVVPFPMAANTVGLARRDSASGPTGTGMIPSGLGVGNGRCPKW